MASYTKEELLKDKQSLEQQLKELETKYFEVKGALMYVCQVLEKLHD